MKIILGMFLALTLSACSHMTGSGKPEVEKQAKWLILPFVNRTETPQAGLRASAIVQASLYGFDVNDVASFPVTESEGLLFDAGGAKQKREIINWVAKSGGQYQISGVVHEWRYKSGVDGEPAVGIMLQIKRLSDGKVVYGATAAKTGWARESLSETAQQIVEQLLKPAL